MQIFRTPDACFDQLPDYPFLPNYVTVAGGKLRMHFVDEGPSDAAPILCLHGEPSWSFLYRKMIPRFVEAGYRAIAPDLPGFGRSDKPSKRGDYTYAYHVQWMRQFIEQLDLRGITLVVQDWGGLIGLRLVADMPERFSRIVTANTGLPTGQQPLSKAFHAWKNFVEQTPTFDIGRTIQNGCTSSLPNEVVAAYNAPFPSEEYKAGARVFPGLVPISPDDPAAIANLAAWNLLSRINTPWLTAFSDKDPITTGGEMIFQQQIPGAKGQPHTTITGAGHFLQEDRGEEFSRVILGWLKGL